MDYEVKTLRREQINLNDWAFEVQQRGEQPILVCDLFSRAVATYFVENIIGEKRSYNYLFTDSNRLYNFPKETDVYFGELKKKVNDPTFLKQLLRNSIEIPKAFSEQASQAMEELIPSQTTNAELARHWKTMDEGLTKVIPWFWYPWYLSKEDVVTDMVKEKFEVYRLRLEKITDFDEALRAVVFPVKKTAFQLEQEDMYQLVLLAERDTAFAKNKEFKAKAEEYLKKYDWLTTFLLTPVLPMSYSVLVARVERAAAENFKDSFTFQKEVNIKKEKMAEEILEVIKDDQDLIDKIENARELAYVLTAGIEEAYIATAKYLKLLQFVAERLDIRFEETKLFLSQEIYNALTGKSNIDRGELEQRKLGFVMKTFNGQQYAVYGAEGHSISAWIDEELNKVDASLREFGGQVACKGLVRGTVRVVLEPAQAHELEAGEILVCPMTNPDYVPAMKRAAAIITDEGGMLSHAAIMSREFNKPCIISTKIATRLLKNGDMVEVDATKGLVTILKS